MSCVLCFPGLVLTCSTGSRDFSVSFLKINWPEILILVVHTFLFLLWYRWRRPWLRYPWDCIIWWFCQVSLLFWSGCIPVGWVVSWGRSYRYPFSLVTPLWLILNCWRESLRLAFRQWELRLHRGSLLCLHQLWIVCGFGLLFMVICCIRTVYMLHPSSLPW